jgi:hypothetical protein
VTLQLDDFISQTLTQIAKGVAAGAEAVAALGGEVNPRPPEAAKPTTHSRSLKTIIDVEFSVALTVEDGTKTAGGIGVALGVLALGSKGESSAQSGSTTQIKFHVPMTLPRHRASEN